MARQPESTVPRIRVAVIGGGLAGLAAAVAAREHGLCVELFEARRQLGGRAGSFQDPDSGELLDHCQHVAMGCCTNLADFCRRTGVADCFRRDRRLCFIGPDSRIRAFSAVPFSPSPLHLAPALMRLGYLRLRDRLRIAGTMLTLARDDGSREIDIAAWLRQQGEQFWSVVLVSALSETLDRISVAAARKVFVDGFLGSRRAYEVYVPRAPLGEIYDRRIARWLADHGVAVHLSTPVKQIEAVADVPGTLVLSDGSRRDFDYFVVALPWRSAAGVLADGVRRAVPALEEASRMESSPITAVHLWYDRPIMSLPHAVLVGRLGQWVFNRCEQASDSGCYYQVVVSASRDLKGRNRAEIVGRIRDELSGIWPEARSARLLRWRMVTNAEAVFSARPGVDSIRPPQQTPMANLVLAGDWTATGWPATMEGAVRSGYLAVESVLRSMGRNERVLVADLPRDWLARRLIG
ncbi:MAG: FAD-dependent oxidoreductase [Pirellulales bacterium]|nr:FAD-dependent oxidoreductase [Pirellulales bacterium]